MFFRELIKNIQTKHEMKQYLLGPKAQKVFEKAIKSWQQQVYFQEYFGKIIFDSEGQNLGKWKIND